MSRKKIYIKLSCDSSLNILIFANILYLHFEPYISICHRKYLLASAHRPTSVSWLTHVGSYSRDFRDFCSHVQYLGAGCWESNPIRWTRAFFTRTRTCRIIRLGRECVLCQCTPRRACVCMRVWRISTRARDTRRLLCQQRYVVCDDRWRRRRIVGTFGRTACRACIYAPYTCAWCYSAPPQRAWSTYKYALTAMCRYSGAR